MASNPILVFSIPPQFFIGSGGADTVADSADPDFIDGKAGNDRLSGAGEANTGGEWTIHYLGGTDTFHLAGVTPLSDTDYAFV